MITIIYINSNILEKNFNLLIKKILILIVFNWV